MRTFFLLLILFGLALQSVSQAGTAPLLSRDNYLQKSQSQRKTANTLLFAGGALVLTALVIPRGEVTYPGICVFGFCDEERKNDKLKSVVGAAGAATALSSIIFFRAAKRNAIRATTVSLHRENNLQLANGTLVQRSFPALRIRWGI